MNKNELLKYLKHVFEVEIMIREQLRLESYIERQIRDYENSISEVRKTPLVEYKYKTSLKNPQVPGTWLWVALINGFLTAGVLLYMFVYLKFSVVLVVAIIVWIILFIIKNKLRKEDISSQLREIDSHNEWAEEKNQKIKQEIVRQTQMYNEKISKWRQLAWKNRESIEETRRSLMKLYGLNIVYPKYREISPIAMFIEYLSSGRCSELEGAYGAYNIFEDEVKARIIIEKLDRIDSKLDSIRDNQRYMYDAIYTSNKKAESIMHDIKQNISSIEDNTATSRYYNEIAAKNTSILTLVEGYKLMSKR